MGARERVSHACERRCGVGADAATGGTRGLRTLDQAAAWIVSDILSDRSARSLAFGLDNPLATRFWSAVKTGTSKDMRDNWCVGYSDRYTVGVWVGNFGGEPMRNVSGVSGAAPVWLAVMNALHQGQEPETLATTGWGRRC